MNRQEAFNRAYLGLKAQNEPAYGFSGCFYYNSETPELTCAVGQMIPDINDRKTLEVKGVGSVTTLKNDNPSQQVLYAVFNRAGLPIDGDDDINFLSDLQDAHDSNAHDGRDMEGMFAKLRRVATKYHLEIPND